MKFQKKAHLYGFIAALILTAASILIAAIAWQDLPARIPTHFDFGGKPNGWSEKTIFTLFFPAAIQLALTVLFFFLYSRPQYSNMPTTLLLATLPEKQRDRSFELIRNMLVVTMVWINVLFVFVTYMIVSGARNEAMTYQGPVLIVLIIAMLSWLVWYNIYIYRIIKREFGISNGNKTKR